MFSNDELEADSNLSFYSKQGVDSRVTFQCLQQKAALTVATMFNSESFPIYILSSMSITYMTSLIPFT